EVGADPALDWPGPEIRIALCGSSTLDPLAAALAVACFREDIRPLIHVDAFGQYRSTILNPESPLYAFDPRIVFLAVELSSLTPTLAESLPLPTVHDDVASRIADLVSAFSAATDALLVIHDFVSPVSFPFAISPDEQE